MPESRVERVMKESGWQEEYFKYVIAGYGERSVFHELIRKLSWAFGVSPRMAEIRLDALKFERLPVIRHCHYHAVVLHVRHCTCEVEVVDGSLPLSG